MNQCESQPASTCGRDGQCDGLGACRLWNDSVKCVTVSCSGSTRFSDRCCDGTGTCQTGTTSSCCPYMCGNPSCRTGCTYDTDCCAGNFCDSGSCLPKRATGQTCTANDHRQCASGVCVDGVCCNNACTGACRACNRADSVGTCSNHPNITDPETECGTCKVCNGSGACANISNGADPLNHCSQQAASTCGTDGQCNGSGACRSWNSSTVCAAQSCTGRTLSSARHCDGAGNCLPAVQSTCSSACNAEGTACL